MNGFKISIALIRGMKRAANLSAPHVKTSHRTEIAARLLGWRTYASLLHDLRSAPRFVEEFDIETANDFCRQNGVDLCEDDIREMAERLADELGDQAENTSH